MTYSSKIFSFVLIFTSFLSQAQGLKFHLNGKSGGSQFQGKAAVYPDSIFKYDYDFDADSYPNTPQYQTYPSYDANGYLVEEIFRNIRYPGQDRKTLYTYDSKGQVRASEEWYWSMNTSSWRPRAKTIYYKNDKNLDSLEEGYGYSGQSWDLTHRYLSSYMYDSLERPVVMIYNEYDEPNNEWFYGARYSYYYQNQEMEPFEILVEEGATQGVWEKAFYATNVSWDFGFIVSYSEMRPSVYLLSVWDGNDWQNASYDSSVVDEGKTIAYFEYEYDTVNQDYTLIYSEQNQFNVKGDRIYHHELNWLAGQADTNGIHLDSFIYGSSGEILEHINVYYSFLNGKTEYKYKELYYYGATGLTSKSRPSLMAYPNPISTQGVLFINVKNELKQVQLIALDGRIVKEWNTNLDEGISMEGFNKGLYFIRALDQNGIAYSGRVQVN